MTLLAILITLVLAAIALTHTAWGAGVWWPIRDEGQLTRTVVGARGVDRMPGPIPCFLVAAALGLVSIVIWTAPGGFRSFMLGTAGLVLIGRGALAYTRLWRRMTPEQPFATLDKRLFGPLCIALGLSLIILLSKG